MCILGHGLLRLFCGSFHGCFAFCHASASALPLFFPVRESFEHLCYMNIPETEIRDNSCFQTFKIRVFVIYFSFFGEFTHDWHEFQLPMRVKLTLGVEFSIQMSDFAYSIQHSFLLFFCCCFFWEGLPWSIWANFHVEWNCFWGQNFPWKFRTPGNCQSKPKMTTSN